MAEYAEPPADSPFLLTPPVVVVMRHVRVTSADETVVEDGGALLRQWLRLDLETAQAGEIETTIFRPQRELEDLLSAPTEVLFVVPAYRAGQPRAAYVYPRLEFGGVELDALELDGADLVDTQGYAVRWMVPADHAPIGVD